MKIRTKLTLIFFSIVIIILTAFSLAIYFFSADHREDDFYTRMRNKAENTAKLLIEVDEVDLELLQRIERDNPSNLPNERIKIFNSKNQELYTSDLKDDLPVTAELLSEIRREDNIRYRYKQFEVLGFLFAYKYERFTVVVAGTDIYGYTKMENLQQILITVFAISLLMVSFAGWVYAGRVLSPITSLVKEVDSISAASLDRRLKDGNGTDELAKLAQTFNLMLDRLENSFIAQKNFIANASHELRTPITAIAGEIEITLLQERQPAVYIEVLKSLLEDAKSLSRLSTQLLLLAQTSSHDQYKFNRVRADEILWQSKEELLKAHPEYAIQIIFDLSLNDETLEIKGDDQLLKVVFINLMDNACKYSPDKKVNVILRSETTSSLQIEFTNTTAEISQHEILNIFNPFFRGKNAKGVQGSGIGLSLVQRIVKLHNGKIDVQSQPDKVSFILSLRS
jgi:signal transduction histidine kinase